MKKPFKWMESFEQVLTDYNEGQKENNSSSHTYYAGKSGTGKGQVSGWNKEQGMATDNMKVFEVHATKSNHLEEIFQFMFPNGFLLNYDSIEIVDSILDQFRQGSYEDSEITQGDIKDLKDLLEHDQPLKRIEKIDQLLEKRTTWSLKTRLEEVRQKQVEINNRLQQIYREKKNFPGTYKRAYADGVNQSFNVEVFVPISDSMPTCPVPDFFKPFAVPVNDYARHEQMEWGLKIIFGQHYEDYRKVYRKVVDKNTQLEDLKNVEDIGDDKHVQKGEFGDGQEFEVTEVNPEKQALKAFKRRFDSLFSTKGVVCSPGFDHTLRPQLKEAMLNDETDMVTLYTGFLNSDLLRKFVITHFVETLTDIVRSLEPDELKKLDRKFVVSAIEAQEWVKASSTGEKTNVEDIVVKNQLSETMDDSRHYNIDFWFDFKPDKIRKIILSKSSNRFFTSMNEQDISEIKALKSIKEGYETAVKHAPYNNLDGRFPEYGMGFIYLEAVNNVPEWKMRGRKQYGHRLPCPRMCVHDPVDRFSHNDFSFFNDLDRWDTIQFEEYQRKLFKEDWEKSAEEYIKVRKQREEEKQAEEEDKEDTIGEQRKKLACSLLRTKVAEKGMPDAWKDYHEEIHREMVEDGLVEDDYSIRRIEQFTQDLRKELEEDYETHRPDDLDYKTVAESLVQIEEFVFGYGSKSGKKQRAVEYIQEEFPSCGDRAAEEVGEKAAQKAVAMLQAKGLLSNSYHAQLERDEFQETIQEEFDFDETGEDEDDDSGGDSSLEDHTPDEPEESESEEESEEDGPVPDDEWLCLCGRLNPEEATVCQSCARDYEDTLGGHEV
ncbi:hypothetical protein OB919_21465 [Halobacteria archaeon AArc-curdl1]|uniref:Uncharacterized protein n=1 Tax=Natronosalvus hydrolyticus TaxID=2979988 RepID=A0AAP2ZEK1_9EURY|nr:hypothetical protein [Halobacteria archaeon AArc-curdl1]